MLPRRGPHVFVDDLDRLVLDDVDRHHLERVLRLRAGDELTVADGRGRWRPARFGPALEAAGTITAEPAAEQPTTVAFALVKGGRPELIVQKLTELGIDRIVPFVAEHSVVRWDDTKAAKNHGRLIRVAREAAMQSKRAWLPTIDVLAGFADVAALDGAVLADLDADPWDGDARTVLVGPEGGWASSELSMGLPRRQIVPTVLRAETAAIAAGVLVASARHQPHDRR